MDDNEPLTEKTVKDLHSLVLVNDSQNRGIYHKIPARILGADNTTTKPYLIADEMEASIERYHQQRAHPIVNIVWLHLAFETIYPFIDGNGRTGRLLLSFELMKNGYLPVDIKFTDRGKYYDCFSDYHKTGKADALIALIADYELAELERYLAVV